MRALPYHLIGPTISYVSKSPRIHSHKLNYRIDFLMIKHKHLTSTTKKCVLNNHIPSDSSSLRSTMLSLASDVEHIKTTMDEVELLEHFLQENQEEHGNKVTNRSVELRGSIKHLITSKEFLDCLDRLEHQGIPLWGLSSKEHDLILLARDKINKC